MRAVSFVSKQYIQPFAFSLLLLGVVLSARLAPAKEFVTYTGTNGPGVGKHVVFLSGDEEYRSEEGLPQLAKILATRHGFDCTVLFSINPQTGEIDPDCHTNEPGIKALDSADIIVMLLRFREWPDAQMKHFADAYLAGKPIVALRTSTHAFSYDPGSKSAYAKFSWNSQNWPGGFGKQVLGETWVSHHGAHKKEATRGLINPVATNDALLNGVGEIFCTTDVYTANPPPDVNVLIKGQVLAGMEPGSSPVEGAKNDPMQPIAWTRLRENEAGKTNWIFCTTMGAATDLQDENLRRLLVNAVYQGAGIAIPAKADVGLVVDYRPSMYGFDGFKRGFKPVTLERHNRKPSTNSKVTAAHSAPSLQLQPNDHIALIGNALADRFQHTGWMEAEIYSRFPDYNLVFRNLAVAGDEVATRHRLENFGSPEDWLRKTKTDVVFAFFGFNESFHGAEGISGFRAQLDKFLKDTLASNYSGRGSARVVLFSPIANEQPLDPDLPRATNNPNILAYTTAMQEVAASNGVPFVDLFHPSLQLFEDAHTKGEPLTVNGLHLNDEGDRLTGTEICKQLFGPLPTVKGDLPAFEKLRAAVNEKNMQWHQRYRTIDGYNIYGGRSALAYEPGKGGFIFDRNAPAPKVSNYKVMQEEMSQRDVLTANRDKRIWAVAKGGDVAIDDSNVPEVTKVDSNLPGPNPDKSFPFLSGEEAITKMTAPPHVKVNLFASEEQFPELVKPVQMAWDTKGRLWVAAWPNYPERTPTSKHGDSLLVFEDTDGDGKADKCTHFVDNLNGPTGFQFYKDGVLLVQAPNLWFMRDKDADGHADTLERILMGLSSGDSHHTANSLCLDPSGAVYLSDGIFHRTQVETATGVVRNDDAAIYRFEPRTAKLETYICYNFANPHGRVFDYWGDDLVTDATGNNTYFGPAFSGHIDYPGKHPNLKQFWERPSRPCAGTAILTSKHFPEEFQGNFLNCNVISFQGIYRVKVTEDGAGLKGETLEPLLSSSDPNFRPVAVNVGPDGAVYAADWQNPIIGHMQHHLRDPNRDHEHGRIYRLTYEGRSLNKKPKIEGQPVPKLLELLKDPQNQIREWAKVEIAKHPATEIASAARKWAANLKKEDPNYEHNLLEALWVQCWVNVLDESLLRRVLESPEPRARAAATRVLCYNRDRLPSCLDILKQKAADESPRVRLQAVRAASFFRSAEAADVPFAALNRPTDYYLDYVIRETLRQLEPWWRKEITSDSQIAKRWAGPDYAAARTFAFANLSSADLLALPRNQTVLGLILDHPVISDSERLNALAALASEQQTNSFGLLISRIATAETEAKAVALSRLLLFQPPENLKGIKPALVAWKSSKNAERRRIAWAALATADGSFQLSAEAPGDGELVDLLNGIPLITDPDLRNRAFPLVTAITRDPELTPEKMTAVASALVTMNEHQTEAFAQVSQMLAAQNAPKDVSSLARTLRRIPRSKWSSDGAAAAAHAIAQWCKSRTESERSKPEFGETLQTALDLVSLLPRPEATAIRNELKGLAITKFVIRSVREQMRYDTPRLVVEAGKPFDIIFENDDFMPHNLTVVAPGMREKVGLAANAMKPDQLDSENRAYVPKMPGILGATRLLQTGEKQTLKLIAPVEPGDCEYVCTFPGHYQVMWGKLIVTKDVDSYLAANPAPAALATAIPAAEHHHHETAAGTTSTSSQ